MATRVTVIGAGPGGYQAAIRAAQLGGQVTLVEASHLGGTCLNWGCIPTKSLRASARALDNAKRLAEYGVALSGGITPDIKAMVARKDQIVKLQAKGIESLLASHKVELVWGRGSLVAPDLVKVQTAGGEKEIAGDRVILATGSKAMDLPGLAPDGARILNSDQALSLDHIPASLVIIGGGVVGCEFAFMMSTLGCRVSLVEALDRLLPIPSLDPQCSKVLLREMKKRRIKCHLGMVVDKCETNAEGLELSLKASPLIEHGKREPKPLTLGAEMAMVSVGRGVNSQGLGLDQAGVALGERGEVIADAQMRANLPGVFAIGDLLGPARPMLAHMASHEGLAAAANALGAKEEVSYQVVPAVGFTDPEVAWVGLSPGQAEEQGIKAVTSSFLFRGLGKAQALGEIAGQCNLLAEPGGGRLLGAHIIGPHAGDLVHECALAIKLGAGLAQVAHTIHAHPTLSEAVYEAAESALGLCVHQPPPRG